MTFLLSLMTSLKTNSPVYLIPLNLLRSLSPYFIGIITEIIHRSLIIYCSKLHEIFIYYSDLKKNLLLTNLIYQVIFQYPNYHQYLRPYNELCPLNLLITFSQMLLLINIKVSIFLIVVPKLPLL